MPEARLEASRVDHGWGQGATLGSSDCAQHGRGAGLVRFGVVGTSLLFVAGRSFPMAVVRKTRIWDKVPHPRLF